MDMQLGNEDERILGCVDDVMMMWCGMYVEERSWGGSRIKYHKALFTQYMGKNRGK